MELLRAGARIAACGLLGLCFVPCATQARPGFFVIPPTHQASFSLRGTHGYRIEISDAGRRSIFLRAAKGPSSITYGVRGAKTAEHGIDARFPGIGRVSVEFQPTGQAKPFPPTDDCNGRPAHTRKGVFVGTIRFRGEKGFSSVTAQRVRGGITSIPRQVCKEPSRTGPSGVRVRSLSASASGESGLVTFYAGELSFQKIFTPPVTSYHATVFQRRAHMNVIRSVSLVADFGTFTLGDVKRPETATVTPPSPFEGMATFQRTTDSTSIWDGTLKVDFPGIGPLGLAGPNFSSTLCLDMRCAGSEDRDSTTFFFVGLPPG